MMGPACSKSSDLPTGIVSAWGMSTSTRSATLACASHSAHDAPTFPAPMIEILLRILISLVWQAAVQCRGSRVDNNHGVTESLMESSVLSPFPPFLPSGGGALGAVP